MSRHSQGQSLFEVVLALGLSTLILVAIVALVTLSVRNSGFSKNKTNATRYSQEALEWFRSQRDDNWDVFSANVIACGVPPYTQCLETLAWGDCGACGTDEQIDGLFSREASFTDLAADTVTLEIKTYWTDAQGTHEVRSTTILTDWRTAF